MDFRALITERSDEVLTALLDGAPAHHGGHRGVMAKVRTAVVCYLNQDSRWHGDPAALAAADDWLSELEALQADGGLFSSGDNLASPPDSSFTINDVAQVRALLEAATDGADGTIHAVANLADRLAVICDRITPALVAGGVHTPNHRWEIGAALARLHELTPNAGVVARLRAWLAEGVDVDGDGLYSERSANYAAHVSNPCLIAIARVLQAPELLDVVHRNLHAYAALTDPDGIVETVFSRRQDQRTTTFGAAGFAMQARRFALARDCAGCADLARLAQAGTGLDAVGALAEVLAEPGLAGELPGVPLTDDIGSGTGPAAGWGTPLVFGGAGLAVWRSAARTLTVYGGSDVPHMGRIASGLACNPTFARLRSGAAVLESVRLSRDFFGMGPFRSHGLRLAGAGDGDVAELSDVLTTGYYQPIDPLLADPDGHYDLEFEGRFAAAMSFSERARDRVRMGTRVRVRPHPGGFELTVGFEGPATAFAIELAFRPGGTVAGAREIGADAYELVEGTGSYTVGSDTLTFGPGNGSGADRPPEYHPGEAYTFLGGTDAMAGPRVYVTGRTSEPITLTIGG
ncbi:hypothetical protein [Occultella gossypii]|uniref:Heparinase II/III-like protein n=1 Tax=Occultella gossypii TaxID=2800820 RepID=A0ABS7S3L0_9MICO|nr:hypothetical protein [Occultella gossypii]MBZ2194926.1 hypothetical protein [Occultella gossypii]